MKKNAKLNIFKNSCKDNSCMQKETKYPNSNKGYSKSGTKPVRAKVNKKKKGW